MEIVKPEKIDASKRFDDLIGKVNKKIIEQPNKQTHEIILTDPGLTKEERKIFINLLADVGWVNITYITSAENGERPGLVLIKVTNPNF